MVFRRIRFLLASKRISRLFLRVGPNLHIGKGYSIIGGKNITIGDNFFAEDNLRLQTWAKYRGITTGFSPELIIGDNVSFMSNCHISCVNKIIINDGCLLGDNVFITDNFHGATDVSETNVAPICRRLFSKGPVVIGKNVWIGRNVCVMPNVSIGDGAIVGANSVVTHSLPCHSVAVGSPAKVVKILECAIAKKDS